jgi:type IV secretion system protein TrbJ
MRSEPLAALILAGLLTLAPTPGHPQAVVCANCATELTQIANNLQLVDHLARQVELVQQAIQQSANLALNTRRLDAQHWGSTLAEIRRVNALLGQGKALASSTTDLDARFASKYGDYDTYVDQQARGTTLSEKKLQQWSEDTNASVLGTLKAAGLSAQQIEGEEDSYLRGLETLAGTAEGRMQAIEVGNQIAMAAVRQTQKLRQIMLIEVQLLANAAQQRSDRETTEAAAWHNFSKAAALPPRNGARY